MWYGSRMSIERADIFISSLGLEAYRVGGSVRDDLLGRRSKDADYMIRGVPLFDLGRALRTAVKGMDKAAVKPLVLRDGRQAGWRASARGVGLIEITLPRTERSTGPGHRDFEIVIDPKLSLSEDAARRDFTFNALYMRVEDIAGIAIDRTVVDPTGRGLYDLQHKLVRTTHPDSFRDDPLRTLRALRFVSTLGYDLATMTDCEMRAHADAVTGLSSKGYASGTVLDEMSRILMGDDVAKALRLARGTGVLASLFPGLAAMLGFEQGSRYHDLTTDEHVFTALETAAKADAPLRVRWALLFHDAGKPESAWVGTDGRKHYYESKTSGTLDHEVISERLWREAAKHMNAPKALREDVARLIREHMVPIGKKNPDIWVRRQRVRLGDALLNDLLLHRACDLAGKGTSHRNLSAIGSVAGMHEALEAARAAAVPASVRDLQISGADAIEAGMNGRDIGAALAGVLDEVVCDPSPLKLGREWQRSRLGLGEDG